MVRLDPKVEESIREVFRGKVCSVCGQSAERFCRKAYYCGNCLPPSQKADYSVRLREVRTHVGK